MQKQQTEAITQCPKELRRHAEFLRNQTPSELIEESFSFTAPSKCEHEIESAAYRIQEEANKMVELLKARKKKGYSLDESDLTWIVHYAKIIDEKAKEKKLTENVLRDIKYAQDHSKSRADLEESRADIQEGKN